MKLQTGTAIPAAHDNLTMNHKHSRAASTLIHKSSSSIRAPTQQPALLQLHLLLLSVLLLLLLWQLLRVAAAWRRR
jgi:hypothetical protein